MRTALVLLCIGGLGCAAEVDPLANDDTAEGQASVTVTRLRPIADRGSWQVEGTNAGTVVTTNLYQLVDDATPDNGTLVRTMAGASSGSHRTAYGTGPAGTASSVTVRYRAGRGATTGSIQAFLFQGSTQIGAGPVHSLNDAAQWAWADFEDPFSVTLASANNLETRIVLNNEGGTSIVRYTQVYLDVSTTAGAATRSPAGAWAIRQVSSLAELDSSATQSQISNALATPGIVGFGMRVPVSAIMPTSGTFDTTILDRGLAIARAHGKLFKPRVIWGRYTPSWATGPTFSDGTGTAPLPFRSDGSANTTFESAYRFFMEREVAWASAHADVRMLDCGWYSLKYSELYFGPGVQSAYGASAATNETRFIAAHERLIDIALTAASGSGIPVGFGLSGHGPIGDIAPALAQHMEDRDPTRTSIFMQANGWGPGGEWGGPLESTLDAGVWPKHVDRAVQDISPSSCRTAANWQGMFASARTLQTTYVEIYTYQWQLGAMNCDQRALDEMRAQIGAYRPVP